MYGEYQEKSANARQSVEKCRNLYAEEASAIKCPSVHCQSRSSRANPPQELVLSRARTYLISGSKGGRWVALR